MESRRLLTVDYLGLIGDTALKAALGPAMPTGAGIAVSQVEHNEHSQGQDYAPDKTDTAFAGKTFTLESGTSTVSQHATNVGEHFYGTTAGVAPGITSINNWEANSWSNKVLMTGTTSAPAVDPVRIENHSWDGGSAGQNGDQEVLQRFDYMINRDNLIAAVAIGNEGNNIVPNLLASNYNAITVGLTNGTANHGTTSFDGSGRIKPDLVAPESTSSLATAQVSGAAALLLDQVNHTTWSAAEKADAGNELVIKSLMMADATKDSLASWSRTPTQPIDTTYGAGQLSVYNNYYTMATGEQGPGTVGIQGWDYAQTPAVGSNQTYTFTVPAGTSIGEMSISLNWNVVVTSTATTGFGNLVNSLSNLSLNIGQVQGGTVTPIDSSTSNVDNVEYLFLRNLGPGTYQFQVGGNAAAVPYAISWAGDSNSTITTLAESSPSTVVGQPVTFTATVSDITNGQTAPTGSVQFYDGTTLLGSGNINVVGGVAQAKFTISTLAPGSHSITASYAGDGTVAKSTSAILSEVVTGSTVSSTSLSSSAATAVAGQMVTFTATVSSTGSGTPTGNVTFSDGSVVLGTAALSGTSGNDTAVFTTSSLLVGSHSITASYGGDTIFTASASQAIAETVSQAQTSGTVMASPGSPVVGQSVILTATIGVVSPGSGLPTGSVSFFDGTTLLGTSTISVVGGSAQASLTTSSLALGGHSITVTYGGDGNYLTSTSPVQGVTIGQDGTTTTLAASPTTSVVGQSVTLTATVAAASPGAGVPTGIVMFSDGSTMLGTGTLSIVGSLVQATLTTSSLAAGGHSLTAAYNGDANFLSSNSAPLSTTVNLAATTTTVTSSPNSPVFGQPITFTASVAVVSPGAGSPTGTVTFYQGTTIIGTGTVSGGLATFTTSSLPQGSVSIKATYGGDTSFATSTSKVLVQSVGQASATVALSSSANPAFSGQSITFTAVVSAAPPGAGTPTGNVTFKDGSTTLATVALSGGTATYTSSSLSVGSHTISVVYNGSGSFVGNSSATLTETISSLSTTSTTIAASINPALFGQTVVYTATVSAGSGTPTGIVTFKQGSTVLGTANLSAGQAVFSLSNQTAGGHAMTAVYGGGPGFSGSTSPAITETITKDSTTTTVVSSANPSAPSQAVTFTASVADVAPGVGTPTGTVSFKDGTKVLGTGTLSGGQATFSTSSLTAGAHSITVTYQGDANSLTSTSAVLSQTVGQLTTTTSVASNANPSVFGQSVTLTASVVGSGMPTGSVTFEDGTTVLGTGTLSAGQATLAVSSLAVGSHSITAIYAGDGSSLGSTSGVLSDTVNTAGTTTSIVSSAGSATYGQSLTFTATVAVQSPGSGTPTGSVTFSDGSTVLGSAPLALNGSTLQASFSTAALGAGSHTVTATYGGDASFASSSTTAGAAETIAKSSTSSAVSTSVNPASAGQAVTFTAVVTPTAPGAGTPTGTVTFKQGSTVLATVSLSGGQATYTSSTMTVGGHAISVVYNGDANFNTSTSSALTETIVKSATSVLVVSSANPSVSGQSVTFTASVTPTAPGAGTPTGNVTFKDGTKTLGTVALSAGQASFAISSLSIATHSITVVYQGDPNFATSTSSTLSQVVTPPASTTSVSASVNPITFGQSTTFTATVAPASGTGTPTGSVMFEDGTAVLGTATLSGGKALFTAASLTGGNHSITAVYSGSTSYAPGTSAVLTETVNQANSTTTLGVDNPSPVFGQTVTFTANVAAVAPGSGTPTGSLTFYDNGNLLGTSTLSGGQATLATSALAVGSNSVTAVYTGDGNFVVSTSSALGESVAQASSSTTVSVDTNPAVSGQTVTFTATVAAVAPGAGVPTGSITFYDNGSALGTATLSGGQATLVSSALAAGDHPITVSYAGDDSFASSSSSTLDETVGQGSSTTALSVDINPAAYGQNVTFTAVVSSVAPAAGTPTGTVWFEQSGITFATVTLVAGQASATVNSLPLGTTPITAVYLGDSNFTTSYSSSISETVGQGGSTTALSSDDTTAVAGQGVTFTATVAPSGTTGGTPSGSVSFYDGATLLGTSSLNGAAGSDQATLVVSSLALGSHTITASYGGDSNFAASSSGQVTEAVAQDATTSVVMSSANPAVVGQTVTFSVTVSPNAPGGGTPTGTVNFKQGNTVIGSATLSGGVASYTVNLPSTGNLSTSAVYLGDANYLGSTSAALVEVVSRASTATSLTSSANPAASGMAVTFTATVAAAAPGSGTPTGSVTFKDGTKILSTVALSGGQASFTTSSLALGSHSITAVYQTSNNYLTSTSPLLTETISASGGAMMAAMVAPSAAPAVAPAAAVATPGSSASATAGSAAATSSPSTISARSLLATASTARSRAVDAVLGGDADLASLLG